jgi:parallel beta-helix repeat protein
VLFVGMMVAVAVAGAAVVDDEAGEIPGGQLLAGAQADAAPVDSCTVIDEPGRYELTDDVNGAATDACIQIRSDDVELDGNGHVIRGPGSDEGVGILVFNGTRDGYPRAGPALSGVTVRNLTVNGWELGVQAGETLGSGPTVTVENVTVEDNGRGMALFGVDDSEFADVAVVDNERAGVVVWETDDVRVDGLTASRNGGSGISFADVVTESALRDVTVRENDGHGIHFSTVAVNNSVTGATIADNEGAGVIFVDSSDNVVRDSTITGNTGPGVLSDPADGDRVSNVTVADNEIAYRNEFEGVRYGVVADRLRLDSGIDASFDRNVSSLDRETGVPEPPRDARTAGPAANLTMSDEAPEGATATLAFPYADEAVGNETTVGVVRYSDGNWRPVRDTSVDTENQTLTATVRRSGVFVPVALDQTSSVTGDNSTFVVTATGDENADDVAYGFVVDGEGETVSGTAFPPEDGEELVVERDDGTTVVLGEAGTGGGDSFRVTGGIVRFATQPRNASVRLELDGEDVTARLDSESALG